VTVDGERVSPASLRVDIPLDPREHTIAVLQPGKQALTRTVSLSAGSRQTLQFDLSPSHTAAGPAYPPGEQSAVGQQDPNLPKRVVTFSAFGLAVAGAGVGAYFLLDAIDHQHDADLARRNIDASVMQFSVAGTPTAPGSECTPPFADSNREQACSDLSSAITARDKSRTISVWSFAMAGAGALGGTAALLFWPEHELTRNQSTVSFRLVPTLGGALLSGDF